MSTDNFIPEIWSSNLLVNLKNDLVFASPQVANRNYEGEVSAFGDTVRINSIGAVTVGDYVKNVNHAAAETLNDNQQVLVIDQAKMFNFQIDDIDAAQQNPKLRAAAMGEASFALANEVDKFMSALLFAGVPAGNVVADRTLDLSDIAAGTGPGYGQVYEAFVDLGVALDKNNAPVGGRYAVVTPTILGHLRKDARFSSFGTEANRAVVANGAVGRIADFDILVSNQSVAGDGGGDQILAGHNWATTYADQVAEVRAYRPELRFADAVKGLHVYGAKVVRPELLARTEIIVQA